MQLAKYHPDEDGCITERENEEATHDESEIFGGFSVASPNCHEATSTSPVLNSPPTRPLFGGLLVTSPNES